MKLYKTAADLTGLKTGYITVVEFVRRSKRGNWWRCECSCGNLNYEATAGDIRSGRITSCGCYRNSKEFADLKVIHGHRRQKKGVTSRTYTAWCEMKRRCNDPSRENYRWYGGKGISYVTAWESFDNFLADMSECPTDKELDRIDSTKNYEPGNCRWLTHADNMKNRAGQYDNPENFK